MSDLANKNVYHAREYPPFNSEEIHKYLKQVDGWKSLRIKLMVSI